MPNELLYRWIVGFLIAAASTIGLYHRIRAQRAGGPVSRRDEGLFLLIGLRGCGLLAMASVAAWLINPRWMTWSQVALPESLRMAGAAVGALSVLLLYASFRSLGMNITDTVATRPNATLVTHGPYRWVRHPLYVAFFMFAMSICLMAANAVLMIFLAASAVLLRIRTPREEAKLIEKFGDAYRDYMDRTGRFFPRVRPLHSARTT